MKRIRMLFAILVLVSSRVGCNIAPPQAYISEIYIESPTSWWIELGLYEEFTIEDWFDSLVVETSYGRSRITEYSVIDLSMDGWGLPYLMI